MADELISGNPASDSDVVNEQAMYSATMYLPLDDLGLRQNPAPSLKDILDASSDYVEANRNSTDPKIQANVADAESYGLIIADMADELGIDTGSVTMNNPSWEAGDDASYGNPRGFMACTFTNGDTTTISFRGTPDGAWPDNGYSLGSSESDLGADVIQCYYTDANGDEWGPMSPMDKATLEYTEHVLGQAPCNDYNQTVNTTGHSKGGHEAMLAAMVFGEIDGCYAFDGYGVSPELYAFLKDTLGEDFDTRRGRIISVNGNNDYVHVLGSALALSENTIHLYTDDDDNQGWLYSRHDLRGLITGGHLNPVDPNGPGWLAETVGYLSDAILSADPTTRNALVIFVMGLFQSGKDVEAVEGSATQQKLFEQAKAVLLDAIIPVAGAIFVAVIVFGAKPVLIVLAMFLGVAFLISFLAGWISDLFDGGRTAALNDTGGSPLIKANTDAMQSHANQLGALDGALSQYPSRAARLRYQGSSVDLSIPIYSDVLNGLWTMTKATKKYLTKTIQELEDAEKNTLKRVPSIS